MPDSIVYTDCLSSYDVLDVSGFTHHRINHSKLFADKQNHINGIENFWNQAKRVLRKYNGIYVEINRVVYTFWMQTNLAGSADC